MNALESVRAVRSCDRQQHVVNATLRENTNFYNHENPPLSIYECSTPPFLLFLTHTDLFHFQAAGKNVQMILFPWTSAYEYWTICETREQACQMCVNFKFLFFFFFPSPFFSRYHVVEDRHRWNWIEKLIIYIIKYIYNKINSVVLNTTLLHCWKS